MSDPRLLAVGQFVFSRDKRISVMETPADMSWTLAIMVITKKRSEWMTEFLELSRNRKVDQPLPQLFKEKLVSLFYRHSYPKSIAIAPTMHVVRYAGWVHSWNTWKSTSIFNGRYAILEIIDWFIHSFIDSLKKNFDCKWYLFIIIWKMVFDERYLINGIW